VARKPREHLAGGIFHVYARGNARDAVYRDDADRLAYLRMLGRTVSKMGWWCLAYCLMDNHVHLLVETPQANLSRGMQRLHGGYAQAFNARHGRSGHVFQGRYGAVPMKSDGQLWAVAAYIARNPLEANLCERPEDWPWSSYRSTFGAATPDWLAIDRLFSHLGPHPEKARRRYEALGSQAIRVDS